MAAPPQPAISSPLATAKLRGRWNDQEDPATRGCTTDSRSFLKSPSHSRSLIPQGPSKRARSANRNCGVTPKRYRVEAVIRSIRTKGRRIIRIGAVGGIQGECFSKGHYVAKWKHNACPLTKKAGKRKWKPRQTDQAGYYIPTTTAHSPRRRLQRPWLDTIEIILVLERQLLPGSRRKPVLRSDCRLPQISATLPGLSTPG